MEQDWAKLVDVATVFVPVQVKQSRHNNDLLV